MSSPAPPGRLHGPRPPPGRAPPSLNTTLTPPPPPTPPAATEQWQPLIITKRPKTPKLQLPKLNISNPGGREDPETYNYYGMPPIPPSRGSNNSSLSLKIPPDDNDRTLRANDPIDSGNNFGMDDLRSTIEALGSGRNNNNSSTSSTFEHRTRSRERSSPETATSTTTTTTTNSATTATNTTPDDTYDDEKWSDSVLTALERLGEGAGGVVWKVKDSRTGEIYARKTIPTHSTPAKQLMSELRHLSDSKHINICDFYGAYMSGSSSELNVVMELCEGGSLEAIGKKIKEINARTSEIVIGKLADGILKGLIHLHGLHIIHRDIKPSNILLTLSGIVKLCDFGVSGDLVDSMVMTFTGTSAYMAPERLNGQSYSVRADVWSTGLSLLELAMNEFPLPDMDGIFALMDYINDTEIVLKDDAVVQWSDPMKDFIHQCLQAKPTQRPHPRDLLKHPWVISCAEQLGDRQMGHWVKRIWGIKREKKDKEKKNGKEGGSSRPVSRHEGQPTSQSSGDVPPWADG